MLGICSKEELDEEELIEEEAAEVTPEEPELTGESRSRCMRGRALAYAVCGRRGGGCGAKAAHQEQDSRGRQDVEAVLCSSVRPFFPLCGLLLTCFPTIERNPNPSQSSRTSPALPSSPPVRSPTAPRGSRSPSPTSPTRASRTSTTSTFPRISSTPRTSIRPTAAKATIRSTDGIRRRLRRPFRRWREARCCRVRARET